MEDEGIGSALGMFVGVGLLAYCIFNGPACSRDPRDYTPTREYEPGHPAPGIRYQTENDQKQYFRLPLPKMGDPLGI